MTMSDPNKQAETTGESESRTKELLAMGRQVWKGMIDPNVPLAAKLIPAFAILYLLSPIDLIPDTIPFLTQIDDLAVLIIAARIFMELVPDDLGDQVGDAEDEVETVETTYRVQ